MQRFPLIISPTFDDEEGFGISAGCGAEDEAVASVMVADADADDVIDEEDDVDEDDDVAFILLFLAIRL